MQIKYNLHTEGEYEANTNTRIFTHAISTTDDLAGQD